MARRLSGHGSLHIKGLTRIISESTTQTHIRPLTQTTFNTQPSKMTESAVNYASMASEIASNVPLHLQGGSKATTVQRQISSFATDMSSKYTNNPSYTPSEEERTALSNLRDALLAGQRARERSSRTGSTAQNADRMYSKAFYNTLYVVPNAGQMMRTFSGYR